MLPAAATSTALATPPRHASHAHAIRAAHAMHAKPAGKHR
jgi:hypothetical protein